MKRQLLTQIKNEWRDNIWLVVELTIVTCCIWLLCTIFYGVYKAIFLPRGFEYSNVYSLKTNTVSQNSPYYVAPPEGEEETSYDDFYALLKHLRENPNVEYAGFHHNGTPYNYNFLGRQATRVDIVDSINYFGNTRYASPEIPLLMGYESLTGKSAEQLREILGRGELLLSDSKQYDGHEGHDVMGLVGARVILDNDSSKVYRVGDIIRNVRRTDYEEAWGGTIVVPMLESEKGWGNVLLKIRKGKERLFKEDFRNDRDLRRQRNVYLSDLTNFDDTREACQRSIETELHIHQFLMLFLIVTIFLGLLGTFWFRIQQRIGEIAIRKTCGATKGDIFRRIIGEGMILLLFSALLLSVIIWPFSSLLKGMLPCSYMELLMFEVMAIAIVGAVIILSLLNPARKAMAIEPAIALKSE